MQSSESAKPYVIVVGTDYSHTGDLAVMRAFELAADRPSAEVHVINVCRAYGPMVYVDQPSQAIKTLNADEASEELRKYTQAKVDDFGRSRAGAGAGGFKRAVTHLRVEAPAAEIAQLASDLEADLVVVGTHGRRGFSRVLLGSVAEAVVRLAPCPVLVVRPRETVRPELTIEPPCPKCIETRAKTQGAELWCEQHRQKHGRPHTYHYVDRNVDSRPPSALLTELS